MINCITLAHNKTSDIGIKSLLIREREERREGRNKLLTESLCVLKKGRVDIFINRDTMVCRLIHIIFSK